MEDTTIVINHETLFEMLRLERSRTELQKLPDSYMEDVKTMTDSELAGLMTNEEDKQKKSIFIKNTLKIINELYERREKKIVNLALDKSKTKSAIIDFSRFLQHEKEMFYEILAVLDKRREDMNNDVFIKGEEALNTNKEDNSAVSSGIQGDKALFQESSELDTGGKKEDKSGMRTVRFLSPVPRFLGPELEEYGPFDEEYIANLPSKIVDILVEKGRAEEIVVSD